MSDWPPKPESEIQKTTSTNNVHQPTGNEWKILEKAVLASVEEQRQQAPFTAGIFLNFLTFAYILFVLVALGTRLCILQVQLQVMPGSQVHTLRIVDLLDRCERINKV